MPTLSQQQRSIADLCAARTHHIIADAVPGAGKSTTLVACAEGAKGVPTLLLCHNARVAEEMTRRLPSWAKARTCHALALGVWLRTNPKAVFRKDKTLAAVRWVCEGNNPGRLRFPSWGKILRLVNAARTVGYVPDGIPGMPHAPLNVEALCEREEIDPSPYPFSVVAALVDASLRACIEHAGKQVDHESLYLTTMKEGLSWPKPGLLLIDEAQDLDPLQIRLVERILAGAPDCRVVAVGDRWQAIYAWRGADPQAIDRLGEALARTGRPVASMFLMVSWRLPVSHVEYLRKRVPFARHVEAAPEARQGGVITTMRHLPASLCKGDLVICRWRAPLARLAALLVRQGVPVRVLSARDGTALSSLVLDCAGVTTPLNVGMVRVMARLSEIASRAVRSGHKDAAVSAADRSETLQHLAAAVTYRNSAATVGDLVRLIGDIYDDEISHAHVTFATIHRAKGAEAERVFVLGLDEIPQSDPERDNLLYVALSRSRNELHLWPRDPQPVREERRETPPPRKTRMTRAEACAVLGLPSEPTADQIKSAYRRAALHHHPDRGGDRSLFERATQARDALSLPL